MAADLKYDPTSGTVTVSLTFQADAQVSKDGLEAKVIEHHLFGQAADLCRVTGEARLHGTDAKALDDDATARKAAIDAEVAAKVAAVQDVTSDVVANPAKK